MKLTMHLCLSALFATFWMGCSHTPTSGDYPSSAKVASEPARSAASEEGYSPEDEFLYKKLVTREEYTSRGANSIRYEKRIGRLGCTKIVAKSDNVVVGYQCALEEANGEGYPVGDEQIYSSLNSKEVYFGRGSNSIRMHKTAGRLSCAKVMSAEKVIVGFECNM